jgi:Holliday junction resolvasome RuvABC endonuclease subunit
MTHITALCLDLSTSAVGYVVGREGEYVGGFQRGYNGSIYARVAHIEIDLEDICFYHEANIVAVERPVYYPGHSPDTLYVLSQAVGVVGLWCWRQGLRFEEFYPATVKAALAHAKADKGEMIRAAQAVTGAEIQGEHHADAVGVWMALWNKIAEERLLERSRTDATQ